MQKGEDEEEDRPGDARCWAEAGLVEGRGGGGRCGDDVGPMGGKVTAAQLFCTPDRGSAVIRMTGCTGKVHGQHGKKGGRHGDGDPAPLHSGQGWLSAVTGRTGKVHGQHGKKDGDMAGSQWLRSRGDVGCQHNVCQHQPHAVPNLGH